jgi:predicted flap endonuclease-1-like 5' DNA nuclease
MSDGATGPPEIDRILTALDDSLRNAARSALSGEGVPAPERLVPDLEETGLREIRDEMARRVGELHGAYRRGARDLAEREGAVRDRLGELLEGRPAGAGPVEDRFVLRGRVADRESDVGLPALWIRVSAADAEGEPRLGSTTTDETGRFRVEYGEEAFPGGEPPRKLFVEVVEAEGDDEEVLHSATRPVGGSPGETAYEEITVPGSEIPERLAAGKAAHQALQIQMEEFARHAEQAEPLAVAGLATGAPGTGDLPEPREELQRVRGVGPTYAERLLSQGIRDVPILARMTSGELAEVLEIPEGRAEHILEEARERVRGEP